MKRDEFVSRYPLLYHATDRRNVDGILAEGLWSTRELLERYAYLGDARTAAVQRVRRYSIVLRRDGMSPAVIRDQKPMPESMLKRCLEDGLSPSEWCERLNAKVFFFVDARKANALAQKYGDQHVFALETKPVIEKYESTVRVARINTGTVRHVNHRRGLSTFQTIADAPDRWKVQEVTVEHGIADITRYLI